MRKKKQKTVAWWSMRKIVLEEEQFIGENLTYFLQIENAH